MDKQILNLLQNDLLNSPIPLENYPVFMINRNLRENQTLLSEQQEMEVEKSDPPLHILEMSRNYKLVQAHIAENMASYTEKHKNNKPFQRHVIHAYAYNEKPKVQTSRTIWKRGQIMRLLTIELLKRLENEETNFLMKGEVINFVQQIEQQLRINNSVATNLFNEDKELILLRDASQKMNPLEQIDRLFKRSAKDKTDKQIEFNQTFKCKKQMSNQT